MVLCEEWYKARSPSQVLLTELKFHSLSKHLLLFSKSCVCLTKVLGDRDLAQWLTDSTWCSCREPNSNRAAHNHLERQPQRIQCPLLIPGHQAHAQGAYVHVDKGSDSQDETPISLFSSMSCCGRSYHEPGHCSLPISG